MGVEKFELLANESRAARRKKIAQRFRGCYETVPALRDSEIFSHFTSAPTPAPCWARLCRTFGARFSRGLFHRCKREPSFVTASEALGFLILRPRRGLVGYSTVATFHTIL